MGEALKLLSPAAVHLVLAPWSRRHAQNASVTLRNEEEEDEDDSEVKQDDLRVFVVHFII